jgi:translocation and assembly module TamA
MRLHEAFLRRQLLIHPGDPYNETRIDHARTTLLGLGVFSSVTVRLPSQSAVTNGQLPITFVVVERKRHAVSLAPEYSSDLGVVAQASWTDRNLFGNAEQLTVSSNVYGVGGNGLATNGVSYDALAQLLKPDFLHTDQSLQFSLQLLRQQLEAYDQVAAIGGATLSRRLSSMWLLSIGGTLEEEQVTQSEVVDRANQMSPGCTAAWNPPIDPATGKLAIDPTTGKPVQPPPAIGCHYTLLGLPISAHYDSTELANPLDDPTHGMRVSVTVTPTESLFGQHTSFVVMQASGSVYFDFTHLGWSDPGDSVLAVRALAGQARGASQFLLPPDQRLYAGGTATVRGYAYQSVGPYFPLPDTPGEYPEGGTGIAASTVELRQRLIGNFGLAAFVDAAEISATADPFGGAYSIGYGAGVRYYTPIGPIRLDVAFPLKRLPHGDSFEAYIGLGQAF